MIPIRRVLSQLNIPLTINRQNLQDEELGDTTFEDFLSLTRVKLRKNPIPIADSIYLERDAFSYVKFIESFFNRTNSVTESSQNNTGETSFLCNKLSHHHWETLCLCIGPQNFMRLLCASSCFKLMDQCYLFLPSPKSWKQASRLDKSMVRNMKMYYQWRPSFQQTRLITLDSWELLCTILEYKTERRNIPKKYRKFQKLIQEICQNEAKLDYSLILNNVLTKKGFKERTVDNNFEMCTPFKEVIEFVILITNKIFPPNSFGCKKNQNIVKDSLIEILGKPKNDLINIGSLVCRMKLTSISWLGKSDQMSSLQDSAMRRNTMQKFMTWVCSCFLTGAVNKFWYVTENSNELITGGIGASFFLHSAWRDLTSSWLSEYCEKYLHEISEDDKFENHLDRINLGILRLLPKKKDFRPLCVSSKRISCVAEAKKLDDFKAKREFKRHDSNYIRPIRQILKSQQEKTSNAFPIVYPRCYSVAEVGENLKLFKERLLIHNGRQLPPLFGVQFDMKHCYDNLNQAKIINCIEALFQNENNEDEFIAKMYHSFHSETEKSSNYKKRRLSIKQRSNVEELDFYKYKPEKLKAKEGFVEQTEIFRFSKDDVLDIVKNQVLQSVIKVPQLGDRYFKRSIGVFQGLPLSETFCDIVYNALVDNVLTIKEASSGHALFLRLADDFLFISSEESLCKIILERAKSLEARNYGAFVNEDKLYWFSSEEVDRSTSCFLGLQIGLRDLSICRTGSKRVTLSNKMKRSFEATLKYLEWRFKLRLSDFILDLYLSSPETIAKNIKDTITPIVDTAMARFRAESYALEKIGELESFLCGLVITVVQSFKKVNGASAFVDTIRDRTWDVIASRTAKEGFILKSVRSLL